MTVLFEFEYVEAFVLACGNEAVLQVGNLASRVAFNNFFNPKAIVTKLELCYITIVKVLTVSPPRQPLSPSQLPCLRYPSSDRTFPFRPTRDSMYFSIVTSDSKNPSATSSWLATLRHRIQRHNPDPSTLRSPHSDRRQTPTTSSRGLCRCNYQDAPGALQCLSSGG